MKEKNTEFPYVSKSVEETGAWLYSHQVREAAVRHAVLPEALTFVRAQRVEDFAALRRQTELTGVVIAAPEEAAQVSRMVAAMRRKEALKRLLPSAKAEEKLCLNIDDALEQEKPVQTPQQAPDEAAHAAEPKAEPANAQKAVKESKSKEHPAHAGEEPLFLLVVSDLENIPSLADLPGAQPSWVLVTPIHACEEEIVAALDYARGIATDTLWEKQTKTPAYNAACEALKTCQQMLRERRYSAQDAAVALLCRGHEGGYVYLTGKALSTRYGLKCGKAMRLVLPGFQHLMEGTENTHEVLKPLRIRDIPDLAAQAIHPRKPMARTITRQELEQVLHGIYDAPQSERPQVEALIPQQQAFFDSGETLDVAFRLRQLRRMLAWIERNEAKISMALLADLGKCAFEAYETEILLVKDELRTAIRHLPRWQRDRRVRTPLMHFPAASRVVRNPYGRALIMAPWNYPFLLSVDPLIAAIAGGNCAILKPSAYAPATSALLRDMTAELFDPEYISVVEGGRAENQTLLEQKFDVIFFTGSPAVGRVVMKAAAEHLTPVTLELGGKSPCIVDDTADVKLAARRIAWGKFINAGQTCVAPDYVVCSTGMAQKLEKELERTVHSFYGQSPLNNPELCHIINRHHFERLQGLMEGTDIVFGGRSDAATLKIEPTVLRGVAWDAPVMQEEIFGPVLPIVPFDGDFDALLHTIEERPRPLAAYLFTREKAHEDAFLRRLRFGGGCINDTVCHLATSHMPFGGVGESGMGNYHGKRGFETFTHEKSVLKKAEWLDLPVRYAPYGEKKVKLLKKL